VLAYHHFSLNRSRRHLLLAFAMLLLPLFALLIFSFITDINFENAVFDLLISMWRLGVAFIIATTIAWLLVVTVIGSRAEGAALALFDVLQSLPTFVILPLGIYYFGQSERTIILFLVITIVWPIIFSIVSSLKQVNRSWREAVTVSRLRGFNYIRYFLFPVTTPGITTGAIIGLGDGWEALIATELLLHTKTGLGPFFASFSTNTTMTLFGVLIFLSIIFTLNKFIWLPLLEKSHRMITP
jgi:ABC-type nitrate/sulfonate/bicarbonate transport system permease component